MYSSGKEEGGGGGQRFSAGPLSQSPSAVLMLAGQRAPEKGASSAGSSAWANYASQSFPNTCFARTSEMSVIAPQTE